MWIIDFASKVGFFISYVATFFLVLEVVRLVCTDANKREAERLLDAYTRGRESEKKQEEGCKLPVDEVGNGLEAFPVLNEPVQAPQTPQRRTRRTVLHRTPTSEKTLITKRYSDLDEHLRFSALVAIEELVDNIRVEAVIEIAP
ncbi:hypothetical protein E8E12_004649 [Didymella heteroderae]|uniref:Uncharacterized protein n=1 Tax=Didymella heteroderae TaxID=1769908 RepID=A0A9P4WV30_9PLEO|nr:hypothetical protein E8E12_004649 [Didymella heteroderae]